MNNYEKAQNESDFLAKIELIEDIQIHPSVLRHLKKKKGSSLMCQAEHLMADQGCPSIELMDDSVETRIWKTYHPM